MPTGLHEPTVSKTNGFTYSCQACTLATSNKLNKLSTLHKESSNSPSLMFVCFPMKCNQKPAVWCMFSIPLVRLFDFLLFKLCPVQTLGYSPRSSMTSSLAQPPVSYSWWRKVLDAMHFFGSWSLGFGCFFLNEALPFSSPLLLSPFRGEMAELSFVRKLASIRPYMLDHFWRPNMLELRKHYGSRGIISFKFCKPQCLSGRIGESSAVSTCSPFWITFSEGERWSCSLEKWQNQNQSKGSAASERTRNISFERKIGKCMKMRTTHGTGALRTEEGSEWYLNATCTDNTRFPTSSVSSNRWSKVSRPQGDCFGVTWHLQVVQGHL